MYAGKNVFFALVAVAALMAFAFPVSVEAAQAPVPSYQADTKAMPLSQNGSASSDTQAESVPSMTTGESSPVAAKEIVVTATRTEREVFDVPSSIAVVDAKQMERQPRGTIAQQLQDIPGIQVSDGGIGGGAKRVTIRGESGARVLVLIDGMKISEQKSMDGSMIMIDPLNVERIEVIKGPASVLYGSEAIGGVVNIITKKGGTRPIQGTLATTWDGSNNSFTPYASLYGSYNGFNYRISGDYTDAGDKIGGSGRIPNTSYMQRNWSAYLDYTWDKGKIGGGYDHYWSSNNIVGETTTETGSVAMQGRIATGQTTMNLALDLPKWERDRYYAFVELEKISDVLRRVKFTPFIQRTVKDFSNNIDVQFNGGAVMGPMGNIPITMDMTTTPYTSNKQTSYGANLQTDWTFGSSHYVIAGIDYLYDDLDAYSDTAFDQVISVGLPPMMGGPQTIHNNSVTHNIYKGSQQTLAAYAQDEWSFHPDWTATFGLRGTWIQSKLSDTNDTRLEEKTDEASNLVGSLGFVYSGFQDWRLRAMYSQGYRNPSLNLLYIGTAHGNAGYNYPNPDLKPETSDNFEIGARYDAHGIQADLSLFYSLADDYITFRSKPNSLDNIFDNVDSATTYGAEFTLGYTHEPWNLTPYISGTYIHRTFDRGGTLGKTDHTGLPNWSGRVGLRYERQFTPLMNLYADVYGRFAAGNKEDLDNGTMERHGGWGTANIAMGARFGEERNFFVDLNLNNLFDKSHVPATGSLEDPGFNAVLRIGVDF